MSSPHQKGIGAPPSPGSTVCPSQSSTHAIPAGERATCGCSSRDAIRRRSPRIEAVAASRSISNRNGAFPRSRVPIRPSESVTNGAASNPSRLVPMCSGKNALHVPLPDVETTTISAIPGRATTRRSYRTALRRDHGPTRRSPSHTSTILDVPALLTRPFYTAEGRRGQVGGRKAATGSTGAGTGFDEEPGDRGSGKGGVLGKLGPIAREEALRSPQGLTPRGPEATLEGTTTPTKPPYTEHRWSVKRDPGQNVHVVRKEAG